MNAASTGRLSAPADPRSWLFWLGLPLVAIQGWWLGRYAVRAPEAAGPCIGRHEVHGSALDPLRLLAVGDSIIAGVALESTAQALPAQLSRAMSHRCGRSVHWQALGRNGRRADDVLSTLLAHRSALQDCDLLLISTGVNDVTGLRRRKEFLDQLRAILALVSAQAPQALVAFVAAPPLQAFPLLPSPLRHVLGLRSRQLDGLIGLACSEHVGACHLSMPYLPRSDGFAFDGFHPNAASCALWADLIGQQLLQQFPSLAQSNH